MKKIKIIEVGPRDGYQSISLSCGFVSTDTKIKYIKGLIECGVKNIQFGSFVSPKAIPQLKDSKEIAHKFIQQYPNINLFALIPNLKGAQIADELKLKKVAYVVSVSKSHNLANINRTHEQSLEAYKNIIKSYPRLEIEVNFATVFGCPFEGKYKDVNKIIEFIKPYYKLGLKSCVLADTIGIADPKQVSEFIKSIKNEFKDLEISVHFHDTRGLAMVNTLAAIENGITKVEAALGGLGGCPFAPGASGNLATEDLVWALNEMGYYTGIDVCKLIKLSKRQSKEINGNYSSHQIKIGGEYES